MKSIRLPSIVHPAIAAALVSLLTLFPVTILAAPDAVEIAGDLKVDAIHFSAGGSVLTSAGPGSFNGGGSNTAGGSSSVISGGDNNIASGQASVVSGGHLNGATNLASVVSGGISNGANGQYSVVSGGHGNAANGQYSVVSGGYGNEAGGDYSWAGGRSATVSNSDQGTFLWADSSSFDFNSTKSNEFAVRATGGVRFVTAIDGGGNPTRTTVIDGNGYVGIGATLPVGPLNVTSGNITSGALWAGNANVNGFEVGGTGTDRYVGIKRDGIANSALHVAKGNAEGGQLVAFYISGHNVGGILAVGTASTTYATTSDARLKENIKPTAFGVDDLMKLEVKDYTFKSDAGGAVQTGFLAQDLYRVIPQAVTVGGDDPATNPWQVDYGRLTPFLVKAVQELKTRNDTLQAENDAMKADNASMKADNESMKERLERIEKLLASLKE